MSIKFLSIALLATTTVGLAACHSLPGTISSAQAQRSSVIAPTPVRYDFPRSAAPHAYAAESSIQIDADYGANLLLVDASGRRAGFDATRKKPIANIAGVTFTDDSISPVGPDDIRTEDRVLDIRQPAHGNYLLEVQPANRSAYHLEIACNGSHGEFAKLAGHRLEITSSEKHAYRVATSSDCSEPFTGALLSQDGASLLSYAAPLTRSFSAQAPGVAHFVVVYGPEIVPESLVATINGRDISAKFHPRAGTIESVKLALDPDVNAVDLQITDTTSRVQRDHFVVREK